MKLKFPTPSPHLFDLKSSSLYISTRASSRPLELMWTFLTWKTTLMTEGFHRCTLDTTRGGPSSLCCSLDHRGTRIWSRCFLATSASTGLHPWCQGAGANDARCRLTAAGQEMPGLRGTCQEMDPRIWIRANDMKIWCEA